MAGESGSNSVVDDLIELSGKTDPNEYLKLFVTQQIADRRGFIARMGPEVNIARNKVGQLNALIAELDALEDVGEVWDIIMCLRYEQRNVEAKLADLQYWLTVAEEEIVEKQKQLKFLVTGLYSVLKETPIIAPTIPPSPDYTPASPDYSPASDSESDPSEDPSSDHIPPLPATSPFLSSDDDPTDSDTPDTPSSPTHDTPFTEITASTQRSPTIPRRRVMLLASGQPIPYGRPYRYHLNGPVHMMTARKRVRPLPTHRLAERHSTDHSSSDSSSEASSDFHSDASSDPSSRHSLSDHSSPVLPSTSAGPSRKRRRSPMTSVPALSPVSGALSPVRADLIPSPKRVRDSGYLTDVEVDHRETSLRDDAIVGVSDEPHLEQDSDPEIQAEIDECFAYADALRDRGIDSRVVVEAIDRDETETGVRGPVEVRVERVMHPVMPEDISEPAQEGSVEVTDRSGFTP
ncbi:hypothetical protein Tco_0866196 [Tanacetum coccineum]